MQSPPLTHLSIWERRKLSAGQLCSHHGMFVSSAATRVGSALLLRRSLYKESLEFSDCCCYCTPWGLQPTQAEPLCACWEQSKAQLIRHHSKFAHCHRKRLPFHTRFWLNVCKEFQVISQILILDEQETVLSLGSLELMQRDRCS